MTETQQRFLRAIAERVPMDHVVELHLFPPIRQGGVETGVAVVAEDPKRALVLPADSAMGHLPVAADDSVAVLDTLDTAPVVESEHEAVAEADAVVEDAAELDDSPYAVSASNADDDDFADDDFDDEGSDDGDAEDDDEDDVVLDDQDDDDVLTGAARSAARVA